MVFSLVDSKVRFKQFDCELEEIEVALDGLVKLKPKCGADDGEVDGFAVSEQKLMQMRVEENGIRALLVIIVVKLIDVQLHD